MIASLLLGAALAHAAPEETVRVPTAPRLEDAAYAGNLSSLIAGVATPPVPQPPPLSPAMPTALSRYLVREDAGRFFDRSSALPDDSHVLVLPSRYYNRGANGLSSFTGAWARGLLARNRVHLHFLCLDRDLLPRETTAAAGRGSIHEILRPYRALESDLVAEALEVIGRFDPRLLIIQTPRQRLVDIAAEISAGAAIPSLLHMHYESPDLGSPKMAATLGRFDAVAAISRHLAGKSPVPTATLGPIVDFGFWNGRGKALEAARRRLRREHGLDGKIVLLMPHRIERDKGQKDALDALSRLEELSPGRYAMVIAGQIMDSNYGLEAMMEGRHLPLVWLDPLGHEALREWYAASDIVLAPSRKEALGLTSIEAQAMGKPVVAYRVDGLPETLAHGKTGLLVDPDAESLAAGIEAASNPETYGAMAAQARAFVRSAYEPRKILAEHERAYARLMRRAP